MAAWAGWRTRWPRPATGRHDIGIEILTLSAPAGQRGGKGKPMKEDERDEKEDMLDEYEFSGGVRGKYARLYAEGSNVVVLSPDVVEAFPDSRAVNDALRALIGVARQSVKHPE